MDQESIIGIIELTSIIAAGGLGIANAVTAFVLFVMVDFLSPEHSFVFNGSIGMKLFGVIL